MDFADSRIGPRVRATVLDAVIEATNDLAMSTGRPPVVFGVGPDPDAYAWVPLKEYLGYLEHAAAALREPLLGLKLCERFQPSGLGPLGLLFTMAPTFAEGFALLSTFLGAWQEGTEMACRQDSSSFRWSYRINVSSLRSYRRQDAYFSVGVMTSWLRFRLGSRWNPDEVHFEQRAPKDAAMVKNFFRCPVYFEQEINRIILNNEDANRQMADLRLTAFVPFMQRHLTDLLGTSEAPTPIVDRVRELISGRMGKGDLTLPTLARSMNVSERTLQRQLTAQGTSLRTIIREERERKTREICHTAAPAVGWLAQQIGYSEASSACRAIKRWTGRRPSELAD